MSSLFGRDMTVFVNTIKIPMRDEDTQDLLPMLRCTFKVEKTLKRQPNTIELTMYNLSPEHRKSLQKVHIPVAIVAGYVDNAHQIFAGDLTYAKSVKTDNDWVTTLQAADGSKRLKLARINTSIKGPAQPADALKAITGALGLGNGNLNDVIGAGSLRNNFKQYTQGIAMSGKADDQLDKVLKPMGYDWSIQDGQLQILAPGKARATQAYVLGPTSGLVGSPEAGDDGSLKVRSLLIPQLTPGQPVQLNSQDFQGFYRIEKTTFLGDTHGNDWFADLECKPIKS